MKTTLHIAPAMGGMHNKRLTATVEADDRLEGDALLGGASLNIIGLGGVEGSHACLAVLRVVENRGAKQVATRVRRDGWQDCSLSSRHDARNWTVGKVDLDSHSAGVGKGSTMRRDLA
jgi:hypothetical protein